MLRRETITAFGSMLFILASFTQPLSAQATYTLKPTPKTVAWGYYDAKAAPVLRVKSGDTVEIQTLITNSPKRLEDAGLPPEQVEQSLRDITAPLTNAIRREARSLAARMPHRISDSGAEV